MYYSSYLTNSLPLFVPVGTKNNAVYTVFGLSQKRQWKSLKMACEKKSRVDSHSPTHIVSGIYSLKKSKARFSFSAANLTSPQHCSLDLLQFS